MYLMVCTRPYFAQALSVVSRYMSNPGKPHWHAVKWLLRYVRGTMSNGLTYSKHNSNQEILTGFVDADYATDKDRRRSLSGLVFTLFDNIVSWKSSLQSVVAL